MMNCADRSRDIAPSNGEPRSPAVPMTMVAILLIVCGGPARGSAAMDAKASTGAATENSESSSGESTPEVVPDRPGASTGTAVVATNHLQLEAGLAATVGEGVELQPLGLLARYGLWSVSELRLAATPVTVTWPDDGEARTTVAAETRLSGKFAGPISKSIRLGALPWISLAAPFDGGAVSAGLVGMADASLSSSVGLTVNVGVASVAGIEQERGVELFGSLAAGFDIAGPVGTYAEVYGDYRAGREVDLSASTGMTYRVMRWMQLDAFVDVGLREFRTWTTGAGVSLLL